MCKIKVFWFVILQTLSGEDVPSIESLDSQISDVDPESKTWGRRMVKVTYRIMLRKFCFRIQKCLIFDYVTVLGTVVSQSDNIEWASN